MRSRKVLRCSPLRGLLFGEQVVLERLDAVVERLHRVEVTVDDDVEQAVHQRADAVLLAAELVEPLGHLVDVELRRQPHRDQPAWQHERGDAVHVEHRRGSSAGSVA